MTDPKTFRAAVRRDRAARKIARHKARTLMSLCDLAERQNRLVPDITQRVGFMGLGELRPALADVHCEADFFFVHEVLEATGATPEQWHQLYDEEIEECEEAGDDIPPRVDAYTMHQPDGSTYDVPVCNWQIALLLALEGPWGKELMTNITPAFRRAMVETGIGDSISAVRLDDDGNAVITGESLTDVILADGPLPSPEVVKQQIANGPLAALHIEDGEGRG